MMYIDDLIYNDFLSVDLDTAKVGLKFEFYDRCDTLEGNQNDDIASYKTFAT